jgi:hypothetical protein
VVTAHYPNGTAQDVTWLTQFFSNDEGVLTVKPDGRVKAVRPGEGVVRAHFQTLVAVARFTMPFENDVAAADFASGRNVLDAPIFKKLADLRIPPSPAADDRAFARRAISMPSARCPPRRRSKPLSPILRRTNGSGWPTRCSRVLNGSITGRWSWPISCKTGGSATTTCGA